MSPNLFNTGLLLGLIIAAGIVVFLITYFLMKRKYTISLQEMELAWEDRYQKGLDGQRAAISGTIFEKFCPFAPEYPYNLSDVIAVFNTFDFMVLKGKVDGKIEEIVIQEMKSSEGYNLDTPQRQTRDCIKAGKVRFETWLLDKRTNKWHCRE